MATYIFHRLIMGKGKFGIFFRLNLDIWNLCIQNFLLSSPLRFILEQYTLSRFHMSFVKFAEFDWLPGRQKG